jgi:hypothetical protein
MPGEKQLDSKTILPISSVYKAIEKDTAIENVSIIEKIELRSSTKDGDYIDRAVTFYNCQIKALDASYCTFNKKLTLVDCIIEAALLSTSFFLSGLTIERCTFKNDIFLFSAGGHNAKDKPIIIHDTIFEGYVDMNDAWFMGPLIISKCNFKKGSNLLGNKGQPFVVTFDIKPELIDNQGNLSLDGDLFDWREVPWTQGEDISKYKSMEPLPGYKE